MKCNPYFVIFLELEKYLCCRNKNSPPVVGYPILIRRKDVSDFTLVIMRILDGPEKSGQLLWRIPAGKTNLVGILRVTACNVTINKISRSSA